MRALAGRAWIAVACAALGASGVKAADTAPAPRTVDSLWLPQPKPEDPKARVPLVEPSPPSAFPELVLPPFELKNYEYSLELRDSVSRRLCSRLLTNTGLKIEPTDTVQQQLIKSQLHQSALEYREYVRFESTPYVGPAPPSAPPFECLKGIQATASVLWADQPSELAHWLEELVVAFKERERIMRMRVEGGALDVPQYHYATRLRLKAEAELWNVKNPAVRPAQPQPARASGEPKDAVKGDWLSATKPPPSRFPDIALPAPDKGDPKWLEKRSEQLTRRCPRLNGNTGLTIEPADGTLQRLLKARLHQGALEIQRSRKSEDGLGPSSEAFTLRYDCLDDTRATAVELFAQQPKELIPWLEELLIEAKELECVVLLRVEAGAASPAKGHLASRHRLKLEAELWKAKNAK